MKAVKRIVEPLKEFTIKKIPRGENRRADALIKLASTSFDHFSKKVIVEVLKQRSIDEWRVHSLTPARHTWMTQIVEYSQGDIFPDSH